MSRLPQRGWDMDSRSHTTVIPSQVFYDQSTDSDRGHMLRRKNTKKGTLHAFSNIFFSFCNFSTNKMDTYRQEFEITGHLPLRCSPPWSGSVHHTTSQTPGRRIRQWSHNRSSACRRILATRQHQTRPGQGGNWWDDTGGGLAKPTQSFVFFTVQWRGRGGFLNHL